MSGFKRLCQTVCGEEFCSGRQVCQFEQSKLSLKRPRRLNFGKFFRASIYLFVRCRCRRLVLGRLSSSRAQL